MVELEDCCVLHCTRIQPDFLVTSTLLTSQEPVAVILLHPVSFVSTVRRLDGLWLLPWQPFVWRSQGLLLLPAPFACIAQRLVACQLRLLSIIDYHGNHLCERVRDCCFQFRSVCKHCRAVARLEAAVDHGSHCMRESGVAAFSTVCMHCKVAE